MWRKPILIAMELKSVVGKSVPFSLENNKKQIKSSQIHSLQIADSFGIKAGFLLNFRFCNETYWIDIKDFTSFINQTEKKSIGYNDVIGFNGVIIPQRIKKIKYIYDINKIFKIGDGDGED